MRIVFFGTATFAAEIFSQLVDSGHCIVAVVTRPDRMKGRSMQPSPPPVKERALQLGFQLPIFQPEKASAPEFAETLKQFGADLFLVVAYGEIIKKNLLEMPKLGCVNIHASLLPKYRGAAPIQRCLMNGDPETGITLIEMTPQMDAGDVLAMESIPVPEDMTFGELNDRLIALACKLVFLVLAQLEDGTVKRIPQDHSLATFAPKLGPEDEKIDWNKPARQIHNQVRALSPQPSAWCPVKIGNDWKRFKIKKTQVVLGKGAAPGEVISLGKEGWIVGCGSDALRLLEVQLEGKRALSAEEFIRGISQPVLFF